MATRVGIISDTHGLMRKEALDALSGVQLILHAGDVGSPRVLEALEAIAPVAAIRGNVDTQPWASSLPETREVQIEAARFFLIHSAADLQFNPAKEGLTAVVSGHTHRAAEKQRDGVHYLNPGSAGPLRFRLPVTLMRVVVDGSDIRAELVQLTE